MTHEERMQTALDDLTKDMKELNGTFQELSVEVEEMEKRHEKNGKIIEEYFNGENNNGKQGG